MKIRTGFLSLRDEVIGMVVGCYAEANARQCSGKLLGWLGLPSEPLLPPCCLLSHLASNLNLHAIRLWLRCQGMMAQNGPRMAYFILKENN